MRSGDVGRNQENNGGKRVTKKMEMFDGARHDDRE
jgi:hypothetical protein